MPFTRDEFFRVFANYNAEVWPAQILLVGFAIFVVAVAAAKKHRIVSLSIAALFAWTAIAYFWGHLAALTPAGRVFGALFLFGSAAFAFTPVEFMTGGRARVAIGFTLLAYALVAYPLIGSALGQRYPAMPTFGAPCPVAIFALALLITARPPVRPVAAIVPLLWSAIATTVAFRFDVLEDLGLLAAGLLFAVLGIPRHVIRFGSTNQ